MIRHKTHPTLLEESKLWNLGHKYVCGIDEVGRGSWAGPVVACAAVFDPSILSPSTLYARSGSNRVLRKLGLGEVRDSKQLSPENREQMAEKLKEVLLAYSVGEAGHEIVNEEGIVKATEIAMLTAINKLRVEADFFLIDYFKIKSLTDSEQKPIKGGDQLSFSIAAASIIAKVYRDDLMKEIYHEEFPAYSFNKHKGYGTKLHQEAIRRFGLSPIHRAKFVPQHLFSEPTSF